VGVGGGWRVKGGQAGKRVVEERKKEEVRGDGSF